MGVSRKFERDEKIMFLPAVYAPEPGYYHVMSRMVGYFAGMLAVIGYIVQIDGKYHRFWIH